MNDVFHTLPKKKKSSSSTTKNVFLPPISYLHKYFKKKKSIPSSKNINYVRQLIKAKLHKTRDGPKWFGLPLDQKKKKKKKI